MQILCTLLPLFNIVINFGNSDVYAYKDDESGFIFTIYFNTMLGNICAYLKQKG